MTSILRTQNNMRNRDTQPVHDIRLAPINFRVRSRLSAVRQYRRRVAEGVCRTILLSCLLSIVSAAHAAHLVGSQRSGLTIEGGQGRLLNFEAPVTSVFVGDPKIADVKVVSPTWVYVFGIRPGSTNLIALDGHEHVRASIQLQVNAESQTARAALSDVENHRATRLRSVGNQLIVDGYAKNVEQALQAQAAIDQNAPAGGSVSNRQTFHGDTQINIRVRFAEVSRNKLRQYGVNWNALVNSGSFTLGLFTGNSLGGDVNTVSGSYQNNGDNIQTILDALQTDGLVRILAEPNITTVTGKTASFLAGGEIPIPVPVSDQLVGIQYKRFGVSLLCTPTLLPNGRIAMDVKPEVSSIVNGQDVRIAGYDVPTLQVRSADTNVQIGSGQTFAIAGLFQRNDSNDLQQLPIIGDIPILGALFRSRRFQQQETELVMLITPYLVRPSSDRKPTTPLSRRRSTPVARVLPVHDRDWGGFGFYEK